ncbi:MAG: MBL fold metallo-hydrolase [Candidatus Burarchaeum sp.]|nr:MBL fold metallo-hydrolase [Candidatus Burarchaeum sp.]MDO8339632.1 MBL fold metallo-hydrolase [Candidatus Burarchaeum sp.]
MELTFLGGAREVGRSAVLFSGKKRVLIDYGVKLHGEGNKETEYPLKLKKPINAYVMSHAHLDHSGAACALYDNASVPCLATYPTQALSQMLITDLIKIAKGKVPFAHGSYKKLMQNFFPAIYGREFEIGGGHHDVKLTLHDAGHIPGAAISEIVSEGKKIVYTADFKMGETLLHEGAKPVEDVDVLVTESTYSNREHPDRAESERDMREEIITTLEAGGNVLLPAFAVGRSQELAMLVYGFGLDVPVYLDGMAKGASEIILQYPKYVRDANALSEALAAVEWIEGPAQRRKALSEPSVIISTAGMLSGGPAINYLLRMNGDKKSKVIFTGYCVEGTNGWHLMKSHKINVEREWVQIELPVKYYDLSAHAGHGDLMRFINAAAPEKILCVHGDHCDEFAEDLKTKGYDAHAPKAGETVQI